MLVRYNSSDPAFRVFNITNVSWNQVHMHMKNALSCRSIDIDSDIVSIWIKLFIQLFLDVFHHVLHVKYFGFSQIKIISDVTLGNNESVTFRDGKTISDCKAQFFFCNNSRR